MRKLTITIAAIVGVLLLGWLIAVAVQPSASVEVVDLVKKLDELTDVLERLAEQRAIPVAETAADKPDEFARVQRLEALVEWPPIWRMRRTISPSSGGGRASMREHHESHRRSSVVWSVREVFPHGQNTNTTISIDVAGTK